MLSVKRLTRLMLVMTVAVIGTSLAGCAPPLGRFATVVAFCNALPQARYAIHGATRYDSQWAAETQEAEVAGCGWQRPAKRPKNISHVKPIPPREPIMPPEPPVKHKRTIRERIKAGAAKVKEKFHNAKEKAKEKLHNYHPNDFHLIKPEPQQ